MFSAQTIKQNLGVTLDVAKKISRLLERKLDPETIDGVTEWESGLHDIPDDPEAILQACNILMNAHGVEAITPDGEIYPLLDYVNMGDTYATTVCYDIEEDQFLITSWGDWLESWESENVDEDEDEENPNAQP